MKKFYTSHQIYFSTLLGGLIPAGILISQNYRKIGASKKANIILTVALVFVSIFTYGIFKIPENLLDKLPKVLFLAFNVLLVVAIYQIFLGKPFFNKIKTKEDRVSNWYVTGYILIGLTFNIIIAFVLVISEPFFPGQKIEFGELKHEVYYDKGDITKTDLLTIGKRLTEIEYFNNEYQQFARVEIDEDKYLLTLPVDQQYWHNVQLLTATKYLKKILAKDLNKPFRIRYITYNLTGKTLYNEVN